MDSTIEGIQRGHLLHGPLSEGGRKHLFCVTKVNGKHSVNAIAHLGKMTAEIRLNTLNIRQDAHEWSIVDFQEEPPERSKRALMRGVVMGRA